MQNLKFLILLSLLWTSSKNVYAVSGNKLNCLSISMSIIDGSLKQRFDDYDVNFLASRLRRSAYNSQLRNALPELKELLQKPEGQVTEGELRLLEELETFYGDREYGIESYAQKIDSKIQRIKNLRSIYTNKVQFSKNASKDLRSLDYQAKEKFQNEIIPAILNGIIRGRVKHLIPNNHLFASYRGAGGYYIVAYEFLENGHLKINMVGPHENFYKNFNRRMGFNKSTT